MERAPENLKHKPVLTVDYINNDSNAHNTQFLSLGNASWDPEGDFSAKVWRKGDSGRWSRQGEELPLWRVLDLAILLVAAINNKDSYLKEFVQCPQKINDLKDFLKINKSIYESRLAELKNLLEK